MKEGNFEGFILGHGWYVGIGRRSSSTSLM